MRQFGAEWFADAVVHATGLAVGLIACIVLVCLAVSRSRTPSHAGVKSTILLAFGLYGLGLMAMLTCSALYNLYVDDPLRGLLRQLDHAAIFVMIAGTATPFALLCVRGARGLRFFAAVWAVAALGIVLKFSLPAQFDYLSIPVYVVLGWAIVMLYRPLREAMPAPGLPLLAAGCVVYTLGVAAFLSDSLHYQLAIWHSFVLIGAACHFTCIVGYATGPTVLCRACNTPPP